LSPKTKYWLTSKGTSNWKSLWLISAASQPMGIARRFAYGGEYITEIVAQLKCGGKCAP
jgi:hypothetical protein